MTAGERIKLIRKSLGVTLEKFGEPLGVTKAAISRLENNVNSITDQMVLSICREYNVNEVWLRTGEGEMFVKLSPAQEVATYVSDLLEDDGENPLYGIIIQIMKTYSGLSPKSQEVIRDFARQLAENIKEKGS